MTTARDIAQDLRKFLNDHQYTLSDLRRGQILILNGTMAENPTEKGRGKGRGQGRKPVLMALRASSPQPLEPCVS